ncbi:MAG: phytoene/squalene synthase family protein [Methanobacterium sp.]|nr:phytoene/squalene synthase family protein [Methanobacterium sp.]
MKTDKTIYSIFKKGSKTYFYSTIFFPKNVRRDVFILYSFLRKADDYVDSIPQDDKGFYKFKERYQDARNGDSTGDVVVDSFAGLEKRKNFEKGWVDAFLNSMEMDLYKSSYKNMDELLVYLYGSSEVVGLFMASIMDLPTESYTAARYLGRAMQYVNFIRDISEDLQLGRIYFPQDEMDEYDIKTLEEDSNRLEPVNFELFLKKQLKTYYHWQNEAEKGFKYIPPRYLIPIKTASDMYLWTAKQIEKEPFLVYKRKVKPSIPKIVSNIFSNSVRLSLSQV